MLTMAAVQMVQEMPPSSQQMARAYISCSYCLRVEISVSALPLPYLS